MAEILGGGGGGGGGGGATVLIQSCILYPSSEAVR